MSPPNPSLVIESISLTFKAQSMSFNFHEIAHFIKHLEAQAEILHLSIIHYFFYNNYEYIIVACLLKIINVTGTGHC